MVIGALVALGLVSLRRIGVDLFPRVEFPYVVVNTTLEGASPEAIETQVTDVIESQVNTISIITWELPSELCDDNDLMPEIVLT